MTKATKIEDDVIINLSEHDRPETLKLVLHCHEINPLIKKINPNVKDSIGVTGLYYATFWGRYETVKVFLEAGADPNIVWEQNNQTPLHLAASLNRKDIAQLLIGYGADTSKKNNKNQTPLDIAKYKGHVEMFALLGRLYSCM